MTAQHSPTADAHELKFTASTWRERLRTARKFWQLGFSVLRHGKVNVQLRKK
jgi:hypothetical protein